jgi:hypothetical protein
MQARANFSLYFFTFCHFGSNRDLARDLRMDYRNNPTNQNNQKN